MTETPTTPQTPVTPQTPAPERTTSILAPVNQVFQENEEAFKAAGITLGSLSAQAPEGAALADATALNALSKEQQEAVQKAQAEGYFINVGGKTFAPTQEGVNRRKAREALTTAAQNGGVETLAKAGLWDKETNRPVGMNRLHPATKDNADISSSHEDDKKAEALLNGYRVEGDWWERNKDWMIPLLLALAGTALGFALSHIFNSKDGSAADLANTLIDKSLGNQNTNENQQTQEDENSNTNGNDTTNTGNVTQPSSTLGSAAEPVNHQPQQTQTQNRTSYSLAGVRAGER